MGLSLLIDVLLRPLGVAVEIVYLDRSEGSQANSHIFQSEDPNGVPTNPDGPMIHLLYRPSHYDILYRQASRPDQQSIEKAAQHSNIQVNRATSLSHQRIQNSRTAMGDFSQLDLTTLLSLPGYAMAPQPSHIGYQAQYQPSMDQNYSHSPISSSISPISPGASVTTPSSTATIPQTYSTQQAPSQQQNHPSPNTPGSSHGLQTFSRSATQLPIHTQLPHHSPNVHRPSLSSHTSMASDLSSPTCAPTSFRPSVYEFTAAAEHEPVVFQTNTFKNSHYNTAHYNNPNFQPEEWTPDCEDPPARKKSG
jgi:ubiquitin thioesterase protein OTUB1